MTELSVSILSADLANLAAETADSMVCGADMVHFDVMDGHFVPNITYGAPVLKCLKKAVPEAFYDVHLMISDPARYAQDFAAAGANLINFHIEAVPSDRRYLSAASPQSVISAMASMAASNTATVVPGCIGGM